MQSFKFCEILKERNINITLLSTGLLLKRHSENILKWVDEVIISLDGDENLHDQIRNTPNAFYKLKEGIDAIHKINLKYNYNCINSYS